ncbi:hypothetical protein FRB96_003312 [Tulasnella sp. 330]|nr:hypothetical protein FRB96_003312 [Tulasnella sp. 330]
MYPYRRLTELCRGLLQRSRKELPTEPPRENLTIIASAPIFQLPAEIIVMVVDGLDQSDLLALIRTCRAMRATVERYLFKDISIPIHRRIHIYPLLEILRDNPELARLTVSLSAFLNPAFYEDDKYNAHSFASLDWRRQKEARDQIATYGALLIAALDNMINLRTLTLLDFDPIVVSGPCQHLRDAASHMSLLALHVGPPISGTRDFSRRNNPDELAYFLGQQSLLQHIELPKYLGVGAKLKMTDIPHLRSVIAGDVDALAIVPGRPVSSLTLLQGFSSAGAHDGWWTLSNSTGPITHVTLRWVNWTTLQVNIEAMCKHLPYLKSLSLERLWSHTAYATEVVESIKKLDHLPTLHIELRYLNGRVPAYTPEAWNRVHAACPNVGEVFITRRGPFK